MQLVLLHALPFDGSMWANQMEFFPETTIAPTLYPLGESIEDWAHAVLELTCEDALMVVGNSVGGSCALEIARAAPNRVKAIVLIGSKAGVRPDPTFRDQAVRVLCERGITEAWALYWAGLFGVGADPVTVEAARQLACSIEISDVIRGVRAFHNRPSAADFLRLWPKPLAIVRGDQDYVPLSLDPAQNPVSARGELHVVKDAGHYTSLERPSDVRRVIQAVLAMADGHT